jgi:acetyl esterase/lipase
VKAGPLERHLATATNALAVLNAANAVRPLDRRHRASFACFAAGLVSSELPVQTLTGHAALNAAAAARGGFRGAEGAASAGMAGVAALGLLCARRCARTAGPAFERALVESLGPDYRRAVRQPAFPGPDAASSREPGVVRMLRIRRRFAHDADIAYGPAGRANLLDIWAREDLPRDGRAPVLVQIPGGAWISGNKQGQAYPLMSHLAERGWICVSINYRLGPRHRWPAQIVDVKRAIWWVRQHIAEHGGDPDFIAVTGGSAGGHLCSLAALTPGETEWQPGFEDADTSVAAAVPFYGVYDFVDEDRVGHPGLPPLLQKYVFDVRRRDHPELYRAASPLHRVGSDAPPFFVVHGVNDSLVPVEQGRLFAQRLRGVSRAPVGYAELPGAQHAFDVFASPRAAAAARAAAAFLGVVYGRHEAATNSSVSRGEGQAS